MGINLIPSMLDACSPFPLKLMSSTFNSDDIKLIEKFVQGSNQLLASERVRMETTGVISQVITKAGEVAAIMYLQNKPRTALIKVDSAYADQLAGNLEEQNFVLIGKSKRAGYLEYHQHIVPTGYKTWYTEPAALWKKWWPTERFQNKQRFNMNILVRMKDNWYPVQHIVIDAGVFIIKTLVGQVNVRNNEQLLWLSQIPVESITPATSQTDAWSQSPEVQKELNKQEAPRVAVTSIVSETIVTPAPPTYTEQLQELERKLYKQQRTTIVTEQRAISAERRAANAEKQLVLLQAQLQKKELEAKWPH
jgi:hypothetical protein